MFLDNHAGPGEPDAGHDGHPYGIDTQRLQRRRRAQLPLAYGNGGSAVVGALNADDAEGEQGERQPGRNRGPFILRAALQGREVKARTVGRSRGVWRQARPAVRL